jgi:hypothetical protein
MEKNLIENKARHVILELLKFDQLLAEKALKFPVATILVTICSGKP